MEINNNISKAWQLRENGNPTEALNMLQQIVKENEVKNDWSGVANTMVDISLCLSAVGDEESLKKSHAVIKNIKTIADEHNTPLREDYYFHLGRVQIGINDYSGAIESLNLYLDDPNLTKAKRAEVYSKIGYALAKSGNIREGKKLILKSIKTLSKSTNTEMSQGKNMTILKKLSAMLNLAEIMNKKSERSKLINEVIEEATRENLGAIKLRAEKLLNEN